MNILDAPPSKVVLRRPTRLASGYKEWEALTDSSIAGSRIVVAKCQGVECGDCIAGECQGVCPVCGSPISDDDIEKHLITLYWVARCSCGSSLTMCVSARVSGVAVPPLVLVTNDEDTI